MTNTMTYKGVGVDYDAMDPWKRQAQLAGKDTAYSLKRFGFCEVEMSRGESAYLIETPDAYIAHVEEGLGTKNLVADAMYRLTGKSYYDQVAQDTVAMIVNDMITLGALPLSVAMHLAVGSSDWFEDELRGHDLIEGWKRACRISRCVWGGGETPTLKGIVVPGTALISGSATGIIKPKERLIKTSVRDGDAIVLLESSGIHANGLTMARSIAERKDSLGRKILNFFLSNWFPLEILPKGYLTRLSDGRTYGETLLDPTHIYVPFIEDCLEGGMDIHYTANITGHGWRKLMRAPQAFTYVIDTLPRQLPIFDFLQEYGPVDDEEAYANFNMGAGFALYVAENDVEKILEIAQPYPFGILKAGYVERSKEKKVIIKPKGLEYAGTTLGVR
jgi:phosphoribosylformylglycinamidine cyclo-ligase